MFSCSSPLGLLRSLVYLSLLGFAVTVLIGPALAVAGTLLPFALVGALVYGGYRFGRAAVARVRGGRPRPIIDEPPAPAPVVFRPTPVEPAAPRRPSRLRYLARSAMYVGLEMGCGAALGAALCVVVDWQGGTGVAHPALGAAIGAVVGFVVGGSRPQGAVERAEEDVETPCQAA
jgi:hypothetical protein